MKVDNQVSFGESLSLRTYYSLSAIADGTQTVIKVAAAIFSSFLSALFLGKSKILNEWSAAHIRDLTVSAKMTWLAVRGVFKPVSSTDIRDGLDSQGVHGLGNFKYKAVEKMNICERFTVRLQFMINVVKEIFDTAISGIRYGLACVFKKIHKSSESFNRITFHEFLMLSSHTAYFFGSCEGVARPKTVNLKMVKA